MLAVPALILAALVNVLLSLYSISIVFSLLLKLIVLSAFFITSVYDAFALPYVSVSAACAVIDRKSVV